jgi:predicted signal transduction protein with EAL and GGDEF domain
MENMVLSRQELEEAMQAGHIKPWYQPKIDPQTLEVLSVEALARWEHPVLGLLTPDVPAAGGCVESERETALHHFAAGGSGLLCLGYQVSAEKTGCCS